MRRFAIGDIHGCYKTLQYLVEEKIKPEKGDKLFFVGDYIDRGADSKAVIDYLFVLRERGINLHLLRGNHEEMLLAAAKDASSFSLWVMNNGNTTLLNFGISNYRDIGAESIDKIPHTYMQFFKSLAYYDDSQEDFLFVHAGLNFRNKDPFADKQALVWQRDENFNEDFMQERTLVHGHTPVSVEEIENRLENKNKIINIDAGCVYTSHPGLGNLVALDMDKMELIAVYNRE